MTKVETRVGQAKIELTAEEALRVADEFDLLGTLASTAIAGNATARWQSGLSSSRGARI